MKKIIITLASVLCLAACHRETPPVDPEPNAPLEVTYNATYLAAGETLTAELAVVEDESSKPRTDLTIYVEAFENGAYCTLFDQTFPMEVKLAATDTRLTLDFPITDADIEGEHEVKFWFSAENTPIKGASTDIVITDVYHVTFCVKDSTEMHFTEGKAFELQANSPVPVAQDLHIGISVSAEDAQWFETLPQEIVIAKGESTGYGAVKAAKDGDEYYSDIFVDFTATVKNDSKYMAESFTLERLDCDTQRGDRLNDERWVYDDPDMPFFSKNTKAMWPACPSPQGVEMVGSNKHGQGSAHPNPKIAEQGWTLAGAYEFHAIDGWSYSRGALSGGIHPVAVANGWGEQATKSVEANMAVANTKYTDVTNEGILRMWACKETRAAQTGGSKSYSGGAMYGNKSINTTMQNTVSIVEGTRLEVRARVRGAVKGFNYAVWLMGNSNNNSVDWPTCGEIDIFENPVFIDDVENAKQTMHQTLHWGANADSGHHNPTENRKLDDVSNWNIYWVEIVDATTVRMGINGYTTREFKASDYADPQNWPFCKEKNPKGFSLLITPGLADSWTGANPATDDWADPAFLNLTYQQSITSELTPRLEIDWIRVWANENYDASQAPVNGQAKMF